MGDPAVDQVELVAQAFRERLGTRHGGLAFSGELLLREALLNAAKHGSSSVLCIARAKRGNLLIVVADGGNGFDWRSRMRRVAEPGETSGRDLQIFRKYASC